MGKGFVGPAVLAMLTLASSAQAKTFIFSHPDEVRANGGRNICLNQSVGPTDPQPRYFYDIQSVDTSMFVLPPGAFRAFMGRSTSWNIAKTANWGDLTQPFLGWVGVQVIRRNPFGKETVVTQYARAFDSSGAYNFAGEFPDNLELGSFVVPAGSIDQYLVRATVFAGPCTESHVRRLAVEIVGP
jgi:hypothetical protein